MNDEKEEFKECTGQDKRLINEMLLGFDYYHKPNDDDSNDDDVIISTRNEYYSKSELQTKFDDCFGSLLEIAKKLNK